MLICSSLQVSKATARSTCGERATLQRTAFRRPTSCSRLRRKLPGRRQRRLLSSHPFWRDHDIRSEYLRRCRVFGFCANCKPPRAAAHAHPMGVADRLARSDLSPRLAKLSLLRVDRTAVHTSIVIVSLFGFVGEIQYKCVGSNTR
jgi:hypothetical protein